MFNFVKLLPYNLPIEKRKAVLMLAEIMDIPPYLISGDLDHIASAMAGVVLYRQINQRQKIEVMRTIRSLANRVLEGKLVSKVLDITVNPRWGVWSLTKPELEDILRAHNTFNRYSSLVGGNPGAYGVGGAAWSIIKSGASTGNVLVMALSIALVGLHEASYQTSNLISGELESRKKAANQHSLLN